MKSPPIEIHINTRGCDKPLDAETAKAIATAAQAIHGRMSNELATCNMPCTSRSIRNRLRNGYVVECLGGSTNFATWRRIQAIHFNEGKHWRGLWVQEHGGLCAWFSPSGARFRLRQEGEKP